jgi:hypothetical protein
MRSRLIVGDNVILRCDARVKVHRGETRTIDVNYPTDAKKATAGKRLMARFSMAGAPQNAAQTLPNSLSKHRQKHAANKRKKRFAFVAGQSSA